MSPQKAIQKPWPQRKTGFGLGRKAILCSQGVDCSDTSQNKTSFQGCVITGY